MTPLRHRLAQRRHRVAVVCALMITLGGVAAATESPLPVAAQTTTTTTLPPIVVSITQEVPPGASLAALPVGPANRTVVNVTNTGTATLYNQQLVVRPGVKPDAVLTVRDLAGIVGVIDILNGGWFHTIAQLTPGGTASFVVTWNKLCPGRFPIAVRAGDTVASQIFQWVGTAPAGVTCPPDETTSPQPASYYLLPWPPSVAAAAATSSVPPSTTTTTTLPVTTTTIPTVTTSTALRSTTTTVVTTTTTTRPAVSTTMVLVCKTVGGTRYCAPRTATVKKTTKKKTTKKPSTTRTTKG